MKARLAPGWEQWCFLRRSWKWRKEHSVALVNSVELYWVVCGVLSKEIDDLETIREAILCPQATLTCALFAVFPPFR